MEFSRAVINNAMSLLSTADGLTQDDIIRVRRIRENWNFYEGYHWEDIAMNDKPQITENYCRPFVNKFISFEFSKSFNIEVDQDTLDYYGENEETHLDFLNSVWEASNKNSFCIELGQSKSITGDGWIHIKYYSKEELNDPFGEYPKGKIQVNVVPSDMVFPKYNSYDKSILEEVMIAYPIEREKTSLILRKSQKEKVIYKQIWTKDKIVVMEGNEVILDIENPYGVIPFVQIKNFPRVGKTEGISDLEDLIPLNVELNIKKSDVSEIIDYHSAPITVVFGARVSQLEKGANKTWGGLPKDARVQNLELNSDLIASVNYINDLKKAMHEIGGVPVGALGGEQAISNTSGVALQFVNMPLIDRTKIKKAETIHGLQLVNKIILHIALKEDLIKIPTGLSNNLFFNTIVTIPDGLPKDEIIELQKIETEMRLDLESKQGAMRRVGILDVEDKTEEIYMEKAQELDFLIQSNLAQAKAQQEIAMNNQEVNDENNINNKIGAKAKDEDDKFNNNDREPKKINSGITNGENN